MISIGKALEVPDDFFEERYKEADRRLVKLRQERRVMEETVDEAMETASLFGVEALITPSSLFAKGEDPAGEVVVVAVVVTESLRKRAESEMVLINALIMIMLMIYRRGSCCCCCWRGTEEERDRVCQRGNRYDCSVN